VSFESSFELSYSWKLFCYAVSQFLKNYPWTLYIPLIYLVPGASARVWNGAHSYRFGFQNTTFRLDFLIETCIGFCGRQRSGKPIKQKSIELIPIRKSIFKDFYIRTSVPLTRNSAISWDQMSRQRGQYFPCQDIFSTRHAQLLMITRNYRGKLSNVRLSLFI
jgi:hypothetical protein